MKSPIMPRISLHVGLTSLALLWACAPATDTSLANSQSAFTENDLDNLCVWSHQCPNPGEVCVHSPGTATWLLDQQNSSWLGSCQPALISEGVEVPLPEKTGALEEPDLDGYQSEACPTLSGDEYEAQKQDYLDYVTAKTPALYAGDGIFIQGQSVGLDVLDAIVEDEEQLQHLSLVDQILLFERREAISLLDLVPAEAEDYDFPEVQSGLSGFQTTAASPAYVAKLHALYTEYLERVIYESQLRSIIKVIEDSGVTVLSNCVATMEQAFAVGTLNQQNPADYHVDPQDDLSVLQCMAVYDALLQGLAEVVPEGNDMFYIDGLRTDLESLKQGMWPDGNDGPLKVEGDPYLDLGDNLGPSPYIRMRELPKAIAQTVFLLYTSAKAEEAGYPILDHDENGIFTDRQISQTVIDINQASANNPNDLPDLFRRFAKEVREGAEDAMGLQDDLIKRKWNLRDLPEIVQIGTLTDQFLHQHPEFACVQQQIAREQLIDEATFAGAGGVAGVGCVVGAGLIVKFGWTGVGAVIGAGICVTDVVLMYAAWEQSRHLVELTHAFRYIGIALALASQGELNAAYRQHRINHALLIASIVGARAPMEAWYAETKPSLASQVFWVNSLRIWNAHSLELVKFSHVQQQSHLKLANHSRM
ncbi:MAG: hypothetical protein IPJ88_10775 [Myxococcales bacterium]|nr:MAG: hypothetical protein IPJ88_10775 [Myxococcales bacterium]